MITKIKWMSIPFIDYFEYLYKFFSRLVMMVYFINLFESHNYLWWDFYHWTQDHWYTTGFLVVTMSYVTFKNAKSK